jgi:hypothetical protein
LEEVLVFCAYQGVLVVVGQADILQNVCGGPGLLSQLKPAKDVEEREEGTGARSLEAFTITSGREVLALPTSNDNPLMSVERSCFLEVITDKLTNILRKLQKVCGGRRW